MTLLTEYKNEFCYRFTDSFLETVAVLIKYIEKLHNVIDVPGISIAIRKKETIQGNENFYLFTIRCLLVNNFPSI